jgi:hypothetical protein
MAKRKGGKSKVGGSAPLVHEQIDRSILVIRGHKVLLDSQLAGFYGVQTRVVVQGAKRNLLRFPSDFKFQLTDEEWAALRSQFVILKTGRGQHRKYLPYAFTEQGVAMLSSVLRSPRAVQVNIQIMRAFVRLRQLLSFHKELADRLTKLEQPRQEVAKGADRLVEPLSIHGSQPSVSRAPRPSRPPRLLPQR